jgi:hypothetical protein
MVAKGQYIKLLDVQSVALLLCTGADVGMKLQGHASTKEPTGHITDLPPGLHLFINTT